MQIKIRRLHTFVEHKLLEANRETDEPLRKVAVAAIIENPYAGTFVEDLHPLIEASAALGTKLAQLAVEAMSPYSAQSYGKGAIVGLAGEQEHANAVLTTTFADPLRKVIGGGKAWISSFTKRAPPGTLIDIPLASKDALYVRSHYDGVTIMLPDAPQSDEIAVFICLANRGRLNARVGGLQLGSALMKDGLT